MAVLELKDEILPTATKPAIRQQGTMQWALSQLPKPRPSQLLAIPRNVFYTLIPQIVRTGLYHEARPQQQQWTDSSWMDGLRGIAALCVVNFHFLVAFTNMPRVGFGYDKDHLQPLALPIIRVLMDGATAVCVFFIISGYVVSAKALRLTANGQKEDLLQALSSSIFRRGFRLFLPMLCIMTITALMAYFGLFEYTRLMNEEPGSLEPPGLGHRPNLKRYKTLTSQLHFLFKEFWKNANIIDDEANHSQHDAHLWTLAFEYRGSLFIYHAILGFSSCRPYVRLAGLILLAFAQLILNRWDDPLFFIGAAFAQLSVMRKVQRSSHPGDGQLLEHSPESPASAEKNGTEQPAVPFWHRGLRCGLFVLALHLMSFPAYNLDKPAPGYIWINAHIPRWYMRKHRLPRSLGTSLLIYLLETVPNPRSSLWMKGLNSSPAQYLGRLMFSFYLVHGPLLQVIGFALPRLIWARIGYQTYWTYVAGLTGGWVLSLLLCLWAAEVFEREVVGRCVKFTAWAEGLCSVRRT